MQFPKELLNLIKSLKMRKDVMGVALFGSYARGEHRPDSDIDVLVLVKKGTRRDVERRGQHTFEFVYASFAEAMAFYKQKPDDCVFFWRDAVVLFDKKGELEKLKVFARRLEKKGKAKLSASQVKHFRFDSEDAARAAKDLIRRDPSTAQFYMQIKAADLTELYFDLRQQWTPPPKQRLAAIRDSHKKHGEAFDAFYTSSDLSKQQKLLQKLVKIVFR